MTYTSCTIEPWPLPHFHSIDTIRVQASMQQRCEPHIIFNITFDLGGMGTLILIPAIFVELNAYSSNRFRDLALFVAIDEPYVPDI
jgi:hypothetical protein